MPYQIYTNLYSTSTNKPPVKLTLPLLSNKLNNIQKKVKKPLSTDKLSLNYLMLYKKFQLMNYSKPYKNKPKNKENNLMKIKKPPAEKYLINNNNKNNLENNLTKNLKYNKNKNKQKKYKPPNKPPQLNNNNLMKIKKVKEDIELNKKVTKKDIITEITEDITTTITTTVTVIINKNLTKMVTGTPYPNINLKIKETKTPEMVTETITDNSMETITEDSTTTMVIENKDPEDLEKEETEKNTIMITEDPEITTPEVAKEKKDLNTLKKKKNKLNNNNKNEFEI